MRANLGKTKIDFQGIRTSKRKTKIYSRISGLAKKEGKVPFAGYRDLQAGRGPGWGSAWATGGWRWQISLLFFLSLHICLICNFEFVTKLINENDIYTRKRSYTIKYGEDELIWMPLKQVEQLRLNRLNCPNSSTLQVLWFRKLQVHLCLRNVLNKMVRPSWHFPLSNLLSEPNHLILCKKRGELCHA